MKRRTLVGAVALAMSLAVVSPASADHSNFPEIYPPGGVRACPAVANGAGQHAQASETGREKQLALYSDACLFTP